MKAWMRMPAVRLALVMIVLIAALGALRVFRSGPSIDAPTESFEAVDAVQTASLPQEPPTPVERPLTLEALGAPNDPLPAAFTIVLIHFRAEPPQTPWRDRCWPGIRTRFRR